LATKLTDAICDQLSESGQDPTNFAAEFDHWKSRGPNGEYSSYLFGKDGAYGAPKVNGAANTLRHVHLVPLKDASELPRWNQGWSRRTRKRSDRHLVYVSDPYYGHLLLWILDEPGSHEIALMKSPEDSKLMRQFAAVADRFIQTGEVTA
jgi:mRNA interferase YafO